MTIRSLRLVVLLLPLWCAACQPVAATPDAVAAAATGQHEDSVPALHAVFTVKFMVNGKLTSDYVHDGVEICRESGSEARDLSAEDQEKINTIRIDLIFDKRHRRAAMTKRKIKDAATSACLPVVEEAVTVTEEPADEDTFAPLDKDVSAAKQRLASGLGWTFLGNGTVKGQSCKRWRRDVQEICMWSGGAACTNRSVCHPASGCREGQGGGAGSACRADSAGSIHAISSLPKRLRPEGCQGVRVPPIKHLPIVLLLAILPACSGQSPGQVPKTAKSAAETPASRVDWQQMAAFWQRALALPGIDTGPVDAKKRMAIYFDPHCPVCARQWTILRPYMDKVRIHWIPVAYIDTSSARVAAAILSAPDPVAALTANEENFDARNNKGGYLVQTEPTEQMIEQVRQNTRTAIKAKDLQGTPTLGFELVRGERYYRMTGMLDADAMRTAVSDLGNTPDPWAKRSAAAQQSAPAVRE